MNVQIGQAAKFNFQTMSFVATPAQLCDEPEEAGILPRASLGAIGQAGEDGGASEVGPWGSGTADVGDHSPKRLP
jgi:hypothetical protein